MAEGYAYRGSGTSKTPEQAAADLARNGRAPTPPQPTGAFQAPVLKGAVKVNAFPPGRSRYPFPQIAIDGGVWKLDPSVFKAKPESVRAAASSWAGINGFKVKTGIDGGHVFIQFTRRTT